jgi:hypothetical protein
VNKRSDFKRRKHDDYPTIDPRAVKALRPYLYGVKTFAEPCCGRGDLVRWLESIRLTCVLQSDIVTGTDALALRDFRGADAIITNPPWSRALLHPLILHFQKYAPTWLLFDSDWAYNRHAMPYIEQCCDIVAVGRLTWFEDTRHSGKDNVSWYKFWHRHHGGPKFHGRR